MLKRDSVNAEQKCRQMQDSVTDAAEGFSELTTIPLNTIYVNLERTQAGSGLLGETENQGIRYLCGERNLASRADDHLRNAVRIIMRGIKAKTKTSAYPFRYHGRPLSTNSQISLCCLFISPHII